MKSTATLEINVRGKFDELKAGVKSFQKELAGLKLPPDLKKGFKDSFSELDRALDGYQSRLNKGFKNKSDITGLEKEGEKIQNLLNKMESSINGLDFSELKNSFQIDTKQLIEATKRAEELKKALDSMMNVRHKNSAGKEVDSLTSAMEKLQKASKSKKLNTIYELIDKGQLAEAKVELEKVGESIKKGFTESDGSVRETFQRYKEAARNLGESIDAAMESGDMSKLRQEYDTTNAKIEEMNNELDGTRTKLAEGVKGAAEKLSGGFSNLRQKIEGNARATQEMNSELDQIKDRVKYFFSLTNAAMLLRRAVQGVFNTIKELDAVMTETAVVTDFSVGDMWNKLPEYTASAKALGVATKDLYAATTLYYQQGLDTNASMAAGVETMKMAKVAGMEASAATDAMTSALRGFNMEVNEANAQNVNDVYSKLAAITASDTEGIATAMSKTAAIAHSVGAEFENIAVFLAQGIETTRESADTIGTAMKTVLARFNEMKKDPAEIGEVDGEIVDANKVETALKSVGIALRDTNGEFRAADQVLLEVASKWDSMSTMQQRYIATTAAGSRQQSRFIAFMSDYDRTLELQQAAYNSAGAAQQQYEKTLESLESKVARLKNTWDEFILGVVDSGFIKFLTDALQAVLSVVNKLSNLPGLLGPLTKIMMGAGALKGGKDLVNLLFSGIEAGKAGLKEGINFSKGFSEGVKSTAGSIGKSYEKVFANIRKNFQDLTKKTFSNKTIKNIDNIPELARKHRTAETNKNNDEIALEMLSSAGQGGSKEAADLQRELNDQTAKAAALQTQYSEATAQTASALGVTTTALTQQGGVLQTISALENAGLSRTYALAAAKSGLTAEQLKQIAVERLGAEATEEEIAAEMKKIILEKQSLVGKIKLTLATAKEAIAKKINAAAAAGEAAGQQASTIQKIAGKLATDALTASTVILTAAVIAAIAAVALLVVGIVALVKAAKENSLEYKMQQAAEETKRATEAANEANKAYNDLLDKKDSINGLQTSLENLTRGTIEWKQAMYDLNQQVLDLIKIYPELSNYISNSDGIMSISKEGWDYIQEQQMQAYESARIRENLAQYNEQALKRPELQRPQNVKWQQNGYEQKDFDSAVIKHGVDTAFSTAIGYSSPYEFLTKTISGFLHGGDWNKAAEESSESTLKRRSATNFLEGEDLYNKLLKDYQDGNDITDQDYLQKILSGTSIADQEDGLDIIKNMAVEVTTYGSELELYTANLEMFKDQIASSVDEIANSEYAEGLSGLMGEMAINSFEGIKEAKLDEYKNKGYAELVTEYAQALGTSEEVIREKYTDSAEDLERLRNDLAAQLASADINDASKEFVKKFQNLDKEAQKALAALGDTGQLTGDMVDKYIENGKVSSDEIKGFLEEAAKTMGYASGEDYAKDMGFEDLAVMVENYAVKIAEANEILTNGATDIKDTLYAINGERNIKTAASTTTPARIDELTDDMTAGQIQAFQQKISAVQLDQGLVGAEKYISLMHDTFEKVGETSKNAILENFNSIDFSEITSIEDFKDGLEDIGVNIHELKDDELEGLYDGLLALKTVASRTIVDLDKAKKQIAAAPAAIETLKEAIDDDNYEFDKEQYDNLIAAGASAKDFFYDGTTYSYLGDTVDLLQKIQNDTAQMRAKMLAQMEQDVRDGAAIADFIDNAKFTDKDGKTVSTEGIIAQVLRDGSWEGKDGDEKVKLTATDLLNRITGKDTSEYTDAQAQAELQTYYDKYGVGGSQYRDNMTAYDNATQEQYGAIATSQSAATNVQNIKEATQVVDELNAKKARGEKLTADETITLTKNTAIVEKNRQALQKKAKDLGVAQEKIEGLTDSQLAQTVAEKKMEKSLKDTADATKDAFEVIEGGATGVEKDAALNEIIKQADLYLGLDLSQEFLSNAENLEKFKKAINGTSEDYYNFINGLDSETRGAMLGIATTEEQVKQAITNTGLEIKGDAQNIQNIISSLDGLQFDVNGNADFTDIFNELLTMGYTVDDAQRIIEGFAGQSIDFDLEYETEYVDLATYKATSGHLQGTFDGSAGDFKRLTYEQYPIKVPKFKGKLNSNGHTNNTFTNNNNKNGNSSGSKSEPYKPDFDPLYNALKKLEKLQEDRNKLEEEYQELLEDEEATLDEIIAKNNEIKANEISQIDLNNYIIGEREKDIANEFATNSLLSEYAYRDETTGKILLRPDGKGGYLIDSAKLTSEQGSEFEDSLSKVTGWETDIAERKEENRNLQSDYDDRTKPGKVLLDKAINFVEVMDQASRAVEQFETDIDLLSYEVLHYSRELLKLYGQQLDVLKEQIATAQKVEAARYEEYQALLKQAEEQGYMKYITEISPGYFQLDVEAIESLPAEIKELVIDWYEKLKEGGEAYLDAADNVKAFGKACKDFEKELQSTAISFFDQVRQLEIDDHQRNIDRLSQQSESIQKAEAQVFDALSKAINERRQEESNKKTEESIADKEARLAYLRADTTGIHDLEIKNLEEDLSEEKMSYAETLIDQKLEQLQQQNDEAAEARERQIEIAQAQLDEYINSGAINKEVAEIIKNGFDESGGIVPGSKMQQLINGAYRGATPEELQQFMSEFTLGYIAYKTHEDQAVAKEMAQISEIANKIYTMLYGKSLNEAAMDALKVATKLMSEDEFLYKHGYMFKTSDINGDGKTTPSDARNILRMAQGVITKDEAADFKGAMTDDAAWLLDNMTSDAVIDSIYPEYDPDLNFDRLLADAEKVREGNGYTIDDLYKDHAWIFGENVNPQDPHTLFVKRLLGLEGFKTGGLADFTGPAWLDGTKSRPELVLNQQDTQNFLLLKDLLSSLLRGTNKIEAANHGDTYLEIHIEVEKLENDYDVDAIADRVKTIISQDAMYRNNNLIVR